MDATKKLIKIGNGKSIHIGNNDIGWPPFNTKPGEQTISYWAICGADHRTNNGTGRKTILGGFDLKKVTCKKCLKREGIFVSSDLMPGVK